MKVTVVACGTRGDVEPCVAAGRELMLRGHDVQMAVSPNTLGLVQAAGLTDLSPVVYGRDPMKELSSTEDLLRELAPKANNPIALLPQLVEHADELHSEKSATLTPLVNGSDLLVSGFNEQALAANIAEYYGIPLVALHYFPSEVLPTGLFHSAVSKAVGTAQRGALGLPEVDQLPAPLEIQAYDEFLLPGVRYQWGATAERRPFVGALTLGCPTDADDEVSSWITSGTPPIYFGLGSTPIPCFAATVATVSAACAQLGERVLISGGPHDFSDITQSDDVMVVSSVNHGAVFPACRALIHHGGAGTTAAGLRAGVPTLTLWTWLDQPMWAAALEQMEVGAGRAFPETTEESLVADLRSILTPQRFARASEVATYMSSPADSLAHAADLLESVVQLAL